MQTSPTGESIECARSLVVASGVWVEYSLLIRPIELVFACNLPDRMVVNVCGYLRVILNEYF